MWGCSSVAVAGGPCVCLSRTPTAAESGVRRIKIIQMSKSNIFSIAGNRIIFQNGKELSFYNDVGQFEIINKILIILIKPRTNKEDDSRNVYGINLKGEILWRIKDLNKSKFDCFYNYIKADEQNNLLLYNRCAFRLKINPADGEILEYIQDENK